MINVLLYVWQLPQHILALILLWVFRRRVTSIYRYEHVTVYRLSGTGWGVSLGRYVFLDVWYSDLSVMHETGHSVQSRYLGPLYLIVVGVPSIAMNILTRIGILDANRYYDRWPENWADRLGGINRR